MRVLFLLLFCARVCAGVLLLLLLLFFIFAFLFINSYFCFFVISEDAKKYLSAYFSIIACSTSL